MQVVCEATQSQDVHVQISAFENLVRIMQLYYDKMKFYMEKALFGVCHRNIRRTWYTRLEFNALSNSSPSWG